MVCNFYENYQKLAEAIILQAVRDYKRCRSDRGRKDIEKFFVSQWFTALTVLDGETIVKRLNRERMMRNG